MGLIRGFMMALMVLLCFVPLSFAGTFTNVVSFGDSLTDVGNLWAATGGSNPPDPPYWQGRSSNGPVWVEYLATKYGLPAPIKSLSGGPDYAWRGASTGTATLPPGVLIQVGQYLSHVNNHADPSALYVVWAGANDVFFDSGFSPSVSAKNVATAVDTLYGAGARTFLVPNMPPLEKTPEAIANPAEAALVGRAADAFNSYLSADLAGLRSTDAGIEFTDLNLKNVDPSVGDVVGVYNCMNYLVAHPHNTPYWDFQNVTEAGSLAVLPADGSKYLFWDEVHPSTKTHQLLAAAVPEPGTLILLAVALLIAFPSIKRIARIDSPFLTAATTL